MTRALITGVTGQDGAYLARRLLDAGSEVYGGDHQFTPEGLDRLGTLGVAADVRRVHLDLRDAAGVDAAVADIRPDEVYNLAAQSVVAVSFEHPEATLDVNAAGVLRLLQALRRHRPQARFFQASTCELFGTAPHAPQDESTPFAPRNPYAIAKVCAHHLTTSYREIYGLFGCCGILFNHESPLRGRDFVTRKISDGVARIKLGVSDRLTLGNLDGRRDWGFAGEYVDAMWRMLQQERPDDYVLATGTAHTVREFVDAAFRAIDRPLTWMGQGLEERGLDAATGAVRVDVSREFFRPTDAAVLVGNAGKARRQLGWVPQTGFDALVATMVQADLERVATEVRR